MQLASPSAPKYEAMQADMAEEGSGGDGYYDSDDEDYNYGSGDGSGSSKLTILNHHAKIEFSFYKKKIIFS